MLSSRYLMIERYRHISFDLDGTLVETAAAYRYKIVPRIIREIGGPEPTQTSIDKFWFGSNRDVMITQEFGVAPEKFWERFAMHDSTEERMAHTQAFQDAETTIRRLKELGKMVTVITGSPEWIAKMEIDKLNGAPIDHVFAIHGSQCPRKPAPDSMHVVLKQIESVPQETLYIGNALEDAHFAKNAGCDFYRVDRGDYAEPEFIASFPALASLEDLFK